jgi:hypothetical protein
VSRNQLSLQCTSFDIKNVGVSDLAQLYCHDQTYDTAANDHVLPGGDWCGILGHDTNIRFRSKQPCWT